MKAGRYFEALVSSSEEYARRVAARNDGDRVAVHERGGLWTVWRPVDKWDHDADGDLLTSNVPLRYFEARF